MEKETFLQRLDEVMNLPKGTIKGNEPLQSLMGWDSVALLNFIGLLDEELKVRVTGNQVIQCKTVGELVALAGDKIAQ